MGHQAGLVADPVVEGYLTCVPERELTHSYPAGMATVEVAVEVMDGEIVRRWFSLAADALGQARSAIDALNVFPVPDADTGTNLYRTMVCAAEAIAELPPQAEPSDVWRAAVSGALLGACGNSGIIVSQLLRGLADTCAPASPCDGQVVAMALMNAAALARAAVHRPAEGTLLTVADAAAQATRGVTSLTEVTRVAAVGARLALTRTEQQLEALAASGVVDAGAAGLCVVFDALSAAISGTAPGGYAVPVPAAGLGVNPAKLAAAALAAAVPSAPASPYAYEVTFLLAATAPQVAELRNRLDQLGDSLVVSGGDPQWHVHVHVAEAGAVIEAGLAAGRPSRITVTYLHGPGAGPAAAEPPPEPTEPASRAHRVVAIAEGAGLARLLRSAGAIVVDVKDAASAVASGLSDVTRLTGPKITIVPNKSLRAAVTSSANAVQGKPDAPVPAGRLTNGLVEGSATGGSVVGRAAAEGPPVEGPPVEGPPAEGPPAEGPPAEGPPAEGPPAEGPPAEGPPVEGPPVEGPVVEIGCQIQMLAALAVHDPERDLADDVAAMRRAVAAMRYASVGPSAAGTGTDLVGRIGDEEVLRGGDQVAVATAVIDRLLASSAELVTLLSGQAAEPGLADLAAAHVRRISPAAEVVCYDGGMSGAVMLIGAE